MTRPIRIAGASGGFSDRLRAIKSLAERDDVDVIVGDWLSEMTMTVHGAGKARMRQSADEVDSWEDKLSKAMFAENFLDCFLPALDEIGRRNAVGSGRPSVRLAVNAGASDTAVLAQLVRREAVDRGYDHLNVAWVDGDEVTDTVVEMLRDGESEFRNIITGKSVSEWGLEPVSAQCYLGGMGIARALESGAHVVICGRVSDASPTIGACVWWHSWKSHELDRLASSLVIGHLLECSAYVTGGYCSTFKELLNQGRHLDLGFPHCDVDVDGVGVLGKEVGKGGAVTVESVTSQLVYEIQGPLYYNCDVTADLRNIRIENVGPVDDLDTNQVRVSGVKGLVPPETTKVGLTGLAGYQAEYHVYLCGLDIDEKCKWTRDQVLFELGPEAVSKFTTLKFIRNGCSPHDAPDQDAATVDLRIFAQSKDQSLLSMRNPDGFFRRAMVTFLQSCPGASLGNDSRQAEGKPYYEYHPSIISQSKVNQTVHFLFDNLETVDIPVSDQVGEFTRLQPTGETVDPVKLDSWGPTVRMPLGRVVLGRSGDKASDCNVGFFVRSDDEWDWLRSMLTVEKLRELMGSHESSKSSRIDRFEMSNIRAVHFLLHDHLDRGYDACSTYDTLGKNFCEYVRAKHVDVPVLFADRGGL